MTTERTLAGKFPSIWKEILPVLTPNFMRLFNESHVNALTDKNGHQISPVPINKEISRQDLVAELAVQSVKIANEKKATIVDIYSNTKTLRKAWRISQSLIDNYEGRKPTRHFNLTEDERSEALNLSLNIERFISLYGCDVRFSPIVRGAGVINTCQADLSIDRTLFEIKTVNRNFRSKDIKQLLIYLALDNSTAERRWTQGGLFNPRRAVWCNFEVESFVKLISGGRTMHEVFAELILEFSRKTEIDTMF